MAKNKNNRLLKTESITISDPVSDCYNNDKIPTLDQMMKKALYDMAYWIEREISDPNTTAVWPREIKITVSNGKNELAVAKLSFQKFSDIQNGSTKILKFIGEDEGYYENLNSLANEPEIIHDVGEYMIPQYPVEDSEIENQ
jgi:hypothetical protein